MNKPIYIYALRLADGKYYIGQTLDLKRRLREHELGCGATFTKNHKPIEFLYCKEFDANGKQAWYQENKLTLEYMQRYGWKNVRGGQYFHPDEKQIWRLLRRTTHSLIHDIKHNSHTEHYNGVIRIISQNNFTQH